MTGTAVDFLLEKKSPYWFGRLNRTLCEVFINAFKMLNIKQTSEIIILDSICLKVFVFTDKTYNGRNRLWYKNVYENGQITEHYMNTRGIRIVY